MLADYVTYNTFSLCELVNLHKFGSIQMKARSLSFIELEKWFSFIDLLHNGNCFDMEIMIYK
jgi:hypothetical protein